MSTQEKAPRYFCGQASISYARSPFTGFPTVVAVH